jgi:hypothetical protein
VVRGQTPGKLKPALTPEHDVHQDYLRPELLCPPQRLSRGSGNADDAQALPFQAIAGGLRKQPIVIYNQDTEPRHVNSVPACAVPRIGASRNRKSRVWPGESVRRRRLGGIQVGSDRAVLAVGPFGWRGSACARAFQANALETGTVECRDRCLVLMGAARFARRVLAEVIEPLGVAHRGIGLQRVLARFKLGAPLLQLRELVPRVVQLLLGGVSGSRCAIARRAAGWNRNWWGCSGSVLTRHGAISGDSRHS